MRQMQGKVTDGYLVETFVESVELSFSSISFLPSFPFRYLE